MANRTKNGIKISDLARERTEDALNFIVSVMNDETVDVKIRLSAAKEIIDRGHGRATSHVEVNQTHRIEQQANFDFSKMSIEAKRQLIDAHVNYIDVEPIEEIKNDAVLPKPPTQ